MSLDRLPETVTTLYAELLERALLLERAAAVDAKVPGGLVAKEIRGRRYLYWQVRTGGRSTQRYLGPDSAELRESLERFSQRRRDAIDDAKPLDRLAAMLLAGGVLRETPRVGAVLRLLADLGLFRRGAVLVGTQAFRTYGNLLGVRLPSASARTQDIDVAHSIDVAVAAAVEGAPAVEPSLAALGFLPVPGLDPRSPSTSFHLRRGELRVDFLTPARGRAAAAPVPVPGLGLAAWPLPLLDYLIDEPVPALSVGPGAVLVRVPRPGRFALNKLFTAAVRPVSEQAKAGKDRGQASALIEVLSSDRPEDLREALEALETRPSARRRVGAELDRLGLDPSGWGRVSQ
jgi:hypothetical protein